MKINRWLFGIFAVILFVSIFVVHALETGNASDLTEANPARSEISDTDGWDLSIVYYDSAVGEGKTPLTSIDWDASNGGYSSGSTRVITVQVNYSNAYSVTTYNPGDLTISIPNLVYSLSSRADSSYDAQWTASVEVSTLSPAKPYDPFEVWSFMDGSTSPDRTQETYTFTNVLPLTENSHYEGSFQIQYKITPASETPEKYLEECVHNFQKELQATLSGEAQATSNTLDFKYTRTYKHPWQKVNYTITKSVGSALTSYDGLLPDADNYYWVRYNFNVRRNTTSTSYPYVLSDQLFFTDQFPEECVIYNSSGTRVEPEDNLLKVTVSGWNSSTSSTSYVVGYPKDKYSTEEGDGKLEITNTAKLYGHYPTDQDPDAYYLNESTVGVDLGKHEIVPPGEIFRITKSGQTYFQINYSSDATSSKALRYRSILEDDQRNMIRWTITATARYRGYLLTVDIGDDLIFRSNQEGGYQRAADDEYYFTRIVIPTWKNGNDMTIPSGKYEYDVFVRYAGSDEYVLFNTEGRYTNGSKTITFDRDDNKVVAWYIRIYDLQESIESMAITTDMYFTAKDIPTSGKIYNYDFLKGYKKDENGQYVLQNGASQYNFSVGNDEITDYDRENHGGLIQRASYDEPWVDFRMKEVELHQYLSKTHGGIYLSAADEYFYGKFTVTNKLQGSYDLTARGNVFFEQIRDQDFFTDFTFYDLLPEGMELISTEEEIIASITVASSYLTSDPNFWMRNGEAAFSSIAEAVSFFKEHSTVTITKDWNGTGRTRIELKIEFKDTPLFCFGSQFKSNSGTVTTYHGSVSFSYNYGISYDSFLTYGKNYKNYAYLQSEDMSSVSTKISDNGKYDPDASDITEDGNTDDQLAYASAEAVISYLVSTYQDVTKFVLTDKIDDYKTGSAQTSAGGEYSYKIRVRSGQSDITNLVIYDSIEQYAKDLNGNIVPAYGEKEHWYGEFLGVDTSFAEARSYTVYDPDNPRADDGYVIEQIVVRVWYSANPNPGDLYTDIDSGVRNPLWEEYPKDDAGFDRSRVKALAFEFLDEDGNHAILPTNVSTYVLIKMRAPEDERISSLAYNGAWTEWQALDDRGLPVDFITGINSNIVKVSMNEVVDVEGTKKWIGDNENVRPDTITVILMQDGTDYDRVTVSADTDWKYVFDGLPKYRADGTEYKYSVRESYVEGYQTEYATPVSGLSITFNEQTRTYNSSYVYIEIYYEVDGTVYLKGKYSNTSLAGATIEVPADNFYIYLYLGSSSSSYYNSFGFLIDSVEPCDRVIMPGTASSLPNKTPIECTDQYPESAHTPHEKTSTLWHYTYKDAYKDPHPGAYDIINTDAHIDVSGTKAWADDVKVYPGSVTIRLLRDGKVYRTTSANADSDWKYIFEGLPKFRQDGSEYEYSVEEAPITGYKPIYGNLANGLAIKFNENSNTENVNYDYVEIYYELDGVYYKLGRYGGKTLANLTVEVPTDHFWLYWHTDGSVNNYYGFSIDSIEFIHKEIDVSQATEAALPEYECIELTKGEYPETAHSPYANSANDLWHYEDSIVWSDTPQAGLYDIINYSSLTELPNTGGPGNGFYHSLLIGYGMTVSAVLAGLIADHKRKKRKAN